MRRFETGATRDSDTNKYDYEGFLSPFVLEQFGAYMHKCRVQADGNLRDSDNWQKGIPQDQYMKSILRHLLTAWKRHREDDFSMDDWMAIIFNAQGYVLEQLIKDGKIQRPTNPTENQTPQDDHRRSSSPVSHPIADRKGWEMETRNYLEPVNCGIPDVSV